MHKTTNGKASPVVAYLRVSSASQTAAMQRNAIEGAASARKEKVTQWYEDRFTGGGRHPPGLVELLSDARAGRVRKLYVYRLDRLSRRGIRDTLHLVEELEGVGVEVVNVADGFSLESAGPARTVIIAVMAWAAQMEREAINERMIDARKRVEAQGKKWGRPSRMTDKQVARAKAMKAQGRSNRAIAAALGIPVSTVGRAVIQKPGTKWGPRALAKGKLRRLKKQGQSVDLRKTRASFSRYPSQ